MLVGKGKRVVPVSNPPKRRKERRKGRKKALCQGCRNTHSDNMQPGQVARPGKGGREGMERMRGGQL